MSSRARWNRLLGTGPALAIAAALSGGLLHCSAEAPDPTLAAGTGGTSSTMGGSPAMPSGGAVSAGTPSAAGSTMTIGGVGGSVGVAGAGGSTDGGALVVAGSGSGGSAGSGGAGGTANVGSEACGNDAIVCEDFESYAANAAPGNGWTTAKRGNGSILVDATRAFRGKQALHVTGHVNADNANITKSIQTTSQTAYVRFMLYATSYPASAGVHTRLLRLGTPQAAGGLADSSYSFSSYNGTAIEKVNSIYQRSTATHLNDAALLKRWNCWEFAIDKTGGVGKVKVHIWLDGKELALSAAGSSSHGMTSNSWDPIPFQTIMLGLDGFQADTQPADFWLDELLVTPERVGCAADAGAPI